MMALDDPGVRPNQSGVAARWVEDANEPGPSSRNGAIGSGRDLDD
jgi:hypothetical protein